MLKISSSPFQHVRDNSSAYTATKTHSKAFTETRFACTIKFIKASGCSDAKGDLEKEVQCLRGLPADSLFDLLADLTTAATKRRKARLENMYTTSQYGESFLSDAAQYFDVYMRPVIDGIFIPACPSAILKSIKADNAPEVLLGNVDKEGMFWLLYGLGLKGLPFLHDDGSITLPTLEQLKNLRIDYLKLIETRFTGIGQLATPFPAITAIEYGFNSPEIVDMTYHDTALPMNDISSVLDFMHKLDDLTGELDFVCSTLLLARLLSNIPNSKVQYFNFMHKTNGSQLPPWTGLMHGYEVEYVFGMPFSKPFTSQYYQFTQAESELSKRVMKYWANFARTGQASLDVQKGDWPLYNSSNEAYLEIGLDKDIVKTHLRQKGCNYWNDVYPSLLRNYLRRSASASHSLPSDNCPHMEINLYKVDRLRDYVDGFYYDGSVRLAISLSLLLGLLWVIY
nr:BC026374 protein (S09 family) [Hymenolepis microstoma]